MYVKNVFMHSLGIKTYSIMFELQEGLINISLIQLN